MNSPDDLTPPNDTFREALDEQLRDLLDVEPAPQQVRRLQEYWNRQTEAVPPQPDRYRILAVVAAAAAVLMLLATIVLMRSAPDLPARDNDLRSDVRPTDPVAERKRSQPALPVDHLLQAQDTLPLRVRPATEYERILFLAQTRMRHRPPKTVSRQLAGMTAGHWHRLKQWTGRLLAQGSREVAIRAEWVLLSQLAVAESPEQKKMTLALLGLCGSPKSVTPLLQCAEQPELRREALQAIQLVAGPTGLAAAVMRCQHRPVRLAAYRQLLTDERGLAVYLQLLDEPRLREELLLAADGLSAPAVESLLNTLDSDDRRQRHRAALVLSHAHSRIVTDALITYVTTRASPHSEAWLALLARRDPRVNQFFAFVSTEPRLLGRLNRARADWARRLNERSVTGPPCSI